jgi:DNA-binding PadR family transcriptional regulator
MSKNKYPEKNIKMMLHCLGISHSPKNNEYIQPNKKYCPYPTSYRNYYQISSCEIWNKLVVNGYAKFHKGQENWQDFYKVTEEGKKLLKTLGYKWHEQQTKKTYSLKEIHYLLENDKIDDIIENIEGQEFKMFELDLNYTPSNIYKLKNLKTLKGNM